jgi:hypothetical protein
MFPVILIGSLIATWTIIGVLGWIADRHNRAGWRRLLDDQEAHHG